MKIEEIQDLIKFISKTNAQEVELETKDLKIKVVNNPKKGKQNGNDQEIVTFPTATVIPTTQAMQSVPIVQTPVNQPADENSLKTNDDTDTKEREENSKLVTIKSPMIGTFYRASSPDDPPFIAIGDEVASGKTICIIEAMKLFNEIEAEITGKLVKVLVDDATPVEYDQPLFLIEQ